MNWKPLIMRQPRLNTRRNKTALRVCDQVLRGRWEIASAWSSVGALILTKCCTPGRRKEGQRDLGGGARDMQRPPHRGRTLAMTAQPRTRVGCA